MPREDYVTLQAGTVKVHLDDAQIAMVAAGLKADPHANVEACLTCVSICAPVKRCACCKDREGDRNFRAGARRLQILRDDCHRTICQRERFLGIVRERMGA